MPSGRYLKWTKGADGWVGSASDGRARFEIDKIKRGGKRLTRLIRLDGKGQFKSCAICSTTAHAKEYANELARLSNHSAF